MQSPVEKETLRLDIGRHLFQEDAVHACQRKLADKQLTGERTKLTLAIVEQNVGR